MSEAKIDEDKGDQSEQKKEEPRSIERTKCQNKDCKEATLQFTNIIYGDSNDYYNGFFECKLCNERYQRCEFGRYACPKCKKNDVCWKCLPPNRLNLIEKCLNEHPLEYITEKKADNSATFLCILCHFEFPYYMGRFICNKQIKNYQKTEEDKKQEEKFAKEQKDLKDLKDLKDKKDPKNEEKIKELQEIVDLQRYKAEQCLKYNICRDCKLKNINKIRQCTNHHPLYYVLPIAGSKEKYTCSNCNKFIYESNGRFICSENCGFNICITCREDPKTLMVNFPRCKDGGKYSYITEFPKWEMQNKFYCTLCFKKGYIENGGWYCNHCYNVICPKCRSLSNYEEKDKVNVHQKHEGKSDKDKKNEIPKRCSLCNYEESDKAETKGTTMKLSCGHYSLCFTCAKKHEKHRCMICETVNKK